MDSLNGVQYLLCLGDRAESLNMENNAFASACIAEKTREPELAAQGKHGSLFCQCAKGNRPNGEFDLPGKPCFNRLGFVFENEVDSRNACGRVAQRA